MEAFRYLFVDDDPERILQIKHKLSRLGNVSLTIAHNYDEAKALLEKDEFSIIMLDHDLSDPEYSKSGSGLIRELIENNLHQSATFIVHSMNIVGARTMMSLLESDHRTCYLVPFHQLIAHGFIIHDLVPSQVE